MVDGPLIYVYRDLPFPPDRRGAVRTYSLPGRQAGDVSLEAHGLGPGKESRPGPDE